MLGTRLERALRDLLPFRGVQEVPVNNVNEV